MKKQLICMAAVAAVMLSAVTSYAATYNSDNSVSTSMADGKQTVLIYKADDAQATPTESNIVYVDQANSVFSGETSFLIKDSAEDGLYKVLFGGGELKTDLFYIGMSNAVGDIPMEYAGSMEYGKDSEGKPLYNMGYKANATGSINSLIIKVKKDDQDVYMGCNLGTFISTEGEAEVGIQINGLPSTDYVKGIWLSPRTISDKTAATPKAE